MKLDFDSYPLNIYSQPKSKFILESIGASVPKSRLSKLSISEAIFASFISKASGTGLLSLIDNVSIGINGIKARKCLSELIQKQTNSVKYNASSLLTILR